MVGGSGQSPDRCRAATEMQTFREPANHGRAGQRLHVGTLYGFGGAVGSQAARLTVGSTNETGQDPLVPLLEGGARWVRMDYCGGG